MGAVLSRMHACKCTHTEIIRYFFLLAQVPGSFPKTFLGHAIPGQQQGGRGKEAEMEKAQTTGNALLSYRKHHEIAEQPVFHVSEHAVGFRKERCLSEGSFSCPSQGKFCPMGHHLPPISELRAISIYL